MLCLFSWFTPLHSNLTAFSVFGGPGGTFVSKAVSRFIRYFCILKCNIARWRFRDFVQFIYKLLWSQNKELKREFQYFFILARIRNISGTAFGPDHSTQLSGKNLLLCFWLGYGRTNRNLS